MIRVTAPENSIEGSIDLPLSKSISNRALVLNLVRNGCFRLDRLSDANDTVIMQKALMQISMRSQATIDAEDAGTCMRFLTALLSIVEGEWLLTGTERLRERPLGVLAESLIALGADISFIGKQGHLPLKIKGKHLSGGRVEIKGDISSQFISALLLIAPSFENGLELVIRGDLVSRPYVNMTTDLLRKAGVAVSDMGAIIKVSRAGKAPDPFDFRVEADWSAASYYYGICALSPSATITLSGLQEKSIQGDSVLPSLFKTLGVQTVFYDNYIVINRTLQTATEFIYDFRDCPDLAQTLAVACFALNIRARLTGLATLRVKETDRLAALCAELGNLGADVSATSDSLTLGAPHLKPFKGNNTPVINVYNDHRMAMSFALLSLRYDKLSLRDHSVVSKSYPAFWEHLKSLGFSLDLLP